MAIHLVINCEPKALSRARASSGHHYYTQAKRDEMLAIIRGYLKGKYPEWNEEELYYKSLKKRMENL